MLVAVSGIYLSRYWKKKWGERDNEREKERWECTCRERETQAEREALERNTCFTSRNETNKQINKKQNREILKFL